MAKASEPTKLNIAEVSDVTGVKQHVLRYWETEFPQLRPDKSGSGQRVYRQKDIDIVLRIKRLLHDEGYTIQGARRKLDDELRETRMGQLPLALDLKQAELLGTLTRARRQVQALEDQLNKPFPDEEEAE